MIGKGPSAPEPAAQPEAVHGRRRDDAGRADQLPLRDRFGATYRLDFYEEDELTAIVDRSAADPRRRDRRRRPRGDRPARPGHAADRQPAPQAGPRPRPGPRRRPGRRGDRDGGDAPDGDRRRGPRLDRSQAPRRDRPEVRLGAGRRRGAGRRAVRGGRDDRGRLRAVPAPARVPRPDAAGPDRDGGRAGAPRRSSATRSRRRAARSPRWPGCGTCRSSRRDRGSPSRDRTRRRRRPAPRRPRRGLAPPPADGSTRARLGRLDADPRRRRDAAVHAGRHERDGQGADPDDLREVGASIILANTYHLYLRPGHERIERLGGLHRFMAWDGPILTDSGGFQVVSLGDLRVVDEDGVTFRSHLDGSTHRFTPEHAIGGPGGARLGRRGRVRPAGLPELAAGGRGRRDRADPPLGGAVARRPHPRRTRRCSGSSRAASSRTCGRSSTRFIASLPFDGICIGGLAGDETPDQRDAALDVAVPLLADDPRPRYLMGLGSPADLLDAVHRGVDLFDSVLPARVARNGQLWVPGGRLNLRNRAFLDDPEPVQDDCPCLALPAVLAGLSGPSVPGQGAPRLPAGDLSQPDLHPRLHGQDPHRDPVRNLPRELPGLALRAGRMSGSEVAVQSA